MVEPLLAWSHEHLRELPWREVRDPWLILVSEVMLQQTQVSRVIPRWREFIERFPTPIACAEAPSGEIIALWAGLGYNRRALNLWKTAVEVRDRFGGTLPTDLGDLQSLPGIGPYTARAVAVFADEQPVGVVDTNVGRLLARWTGQAHTPRDAQRLADQLVPVDDAWRWNQALFDFAVAVCRRRDPQCDACPVVDHCRWQGSGDDPASGSAGVSTTQSRFVGSVRQVRGALVDAARREPVSMARLLDFARPDDTVDTVTNIARQLIAEGMLVERDGFLHLP